MSDTIYIHHICAYNYSEEKYENRAKVLAEAGFIRLRSEKEEGQYWEVWYLPHLLAAKGPCKDMKTSEIVSWLMTKVGAGQIEEKFKRKIAIDHSGSMWGAGID